MTLQLAAARFARMSDDQLCGAALVAGSIGTIITMSLHPSGHVPAAQLESMIGVLIAVHALAIASVPVLFMGTLGLSLRLRSNHRAAMTALAIYSVALIAVINAAVADGLVTPNVLRQIVLAAGTQPAAATWGAISHYNFFVNQAFAQVFVAGSSVALILWSIAAWPGRELPRGLCAYGCVVGTVASVAMLAGHLPLDVHHFGIVILSQAIWLTSAGVTMLRNRDHQAIA